MVLYKNINVLMQVNKIITFTGAVVCFSAISAEPCFVVESGNFLKTLYLLTERFKNISSKNNIFKS